MITLANNVNKQLSIFETLELCRKNNFITKRRYQELLLELKYMSKEFVMRFNHKKSTSISKDNYQRVIDTISYAVNHSNMDISNFATETIESFYNQGNQELNKDVVRIKEIHNQLIKARIQINNDRYNSILDEQIPRFLKTLIEYRGEFNCCHTEEDLDYPLMDGLPLDHHMYQSDGTDLILYYLERFRIENEFCISFKQRVNDLVKQYEECKGIEIDLLNINLCELCWVQYIANRMVQKVDLLLEEKDIAHIYSMENNYRRKIDDIIDEMMVFFPIEMMEYLKLFKTDVVRQFDLFFNEKIEILVYKRQIDLQYHVVLTETRDEHYFEQLLLSFQNAETVEKKIETIQNKEVGLLDLLDLFDHEIFYGEEYSKYFSSCTNQQLALFIKIVCPDLGKFNMKVKIDERFYDEFDCSLPWQKFLVDYLKTINQRDRVELEQLLEKIKILTN